MGRADHFAGLLNPRVKPIVLSFLCRFSFRLSIYLVDLDNAITKA